MINPCFPLSSRLKEGLELFYQFGLKRQECIPLQDLHRHAFEMVKINSALSTLPRI